MPEIVPDILIYGVIALLVGYAVALINVLFLGGAALTQSEGGMIGSLGIHILAAIAVVAGWVMVIVGVIALLLRFV